MKNSPEKDYKVASLLNTYDKTLYLTLKIRDFTRRYVRAVKSGRISIDLGYIEGIIFIKTNIGYMILVDTPFDMAQYPQFRLKSPGLHGYFLKILLLDAETSKLQETHTLELGRKFSKIFFRLVQRQWKNKLPNYIETYQKIRNRFFSEINFVPLASIKIYGELPVLYTKHEMIEKNKTENLQFLVFGEHISGETVLADSCLSPYHTWKFCYDGKMYYSMVHLLAAWKTALVYDISSYSKVQNTTYALRYKELYNQANGTDNAVWEYSEYLFLVDGYLTKFMQDNYLKDYLLATVDKILVYADTDTEWGIGLSADNPNVTNPSEWLGNNLIGFALMDVRGMLREVDKICNL